jgi:hypothetical protein
MGSMTKIGSTNQLSVLSLGRGSEIVRLILDQGMCRVLALGS